jgi:hypothetical protein
VVGSPPGGVGMNGEPHANRPWMPGYGILGPEEGTGLRPWPWARDRLERARTYWMATTGPDGGPHAMAVWGLWLDDRFWFSSDLRSRKVRNLTADSRCAITAEIEQDALTVEGTAGRSTDEEQYRRFAQAYDAKYGWKLESDTYPLFVVRPQVVFAFSMDDFVGSATRWRFGPEP